MYHLTETWGGIRVTAASAVLVVKAWEPCPPAVVMVMEATFESEHGKHHPPEPRSRSQPQPQDFLGTKQRPFDSLGETPLSMELIASQKQLPLLHHRVVLVLSRDRVVIIIIIIPKWLTPKQRVHAINIAAYTHHIILLTVLHGTPNMK